MKDKPQAVARKILGPDASDEAVEASTRMVKLLGDAFTLAGKHDARVCMETRGLATGAIMVISVKQLDDN